MISEGKLQAGEAEQAALKSSLVAQMVKTLPFSDISENIQYEVDIAMMISSQTLRDDNIPNQMNEISSIVLSKPV